MNLGGSSLLFFFRFLALAWGTFNDALPLLLLLLLVFVICVFWMYSQIPKQPNQTGQTAIYHSSVKAFWGKINLLLFTFFHGSNERVVIVCVYAQTNIHLCVRMYVCMYVYNQQRCH